MTIKDLIKTLSRFSDDLDVTFKSESIGAVKGDNFAGNVILIGIQNLPLGPCQCQDPDCPHCQGSCQEQATETLFRVDQEDKTDTAMCYFCGDDALASGVFNVSESKPQ